MWVRELVSGQPFLLGVHEDVTTFGDVKCMFEVMRFAGHIASLSEADLIEHTGV